MSRSAKPLVTIRRISLTCWLALLACSAPTALADSFFKPFTASFRVYRSAIPLGNLELRLDLLPGGNYRYRAHTIPGFLTGFFSGDEIIEESQGRVDQTTVRPDRYLYTQTGDEKENTQVVFDWSKQTVVTTSKGITWKQPIKVDTQDRLSQQLMVRLQLAQKHRDVEYQVADGGKIKSYRFRVVNQERIKTPYGRFDCLRVERHKESRPPDYTIWFAKDLDYLPVRIERRKGGRRYKMVLDELTGLGVAE